MKARQGFTLIEMLVATALTLFLMTIMSEAFVTALDTFTQLKALGDMEEGLRTATINLRFDLSQNHFEGQRRLSDGTLATSPIQQGFFELYQGASSQPEGTDNDLHIPSYFSPPISPPAAGLAGSHVLHFTVKLQGDRPESFFSAPLPTSPPMPGPSPLAPNLPSGQITLGQLPDALYIPSVTTFNSQWAEVAYFLYPTGSTTNPNDLTPPVGGLPASYVPGSNTPLYGLFRAQLLLPLRSDQINNNLNTAKAFANSSYLNVACTDNGNGNNPLTFFTPTDVAAGFTSRPIGAANPLQRGSKAVSQIADLPYVGATRLLNNVVSFNVRVMSTFSQANGGFADLAAAPNPNDTAENAGAFPAIFGAFPARYDTALAPSFIGQTPQILALEISIRVWDPATKQSRQITIIQAM